MEYFDHVVGFTEYGKLKPLLELLLCNTFECRALTGKRRERSHSICVCTGIAVLLEKIDLGLTQKLLPRHCASAIRLYKLYFTLILNHSPSLVHTLCMVALRFLLLRGNGHRPREDFCGSSISTREVMTERALPSALHQDARIMQHEKERNERMTIGVKVPTMKWICRVAEQNSSAGEGRVISTEFLSFTITTTISYYACQ